MDTQQEQVPVAWVRFCSNGGVEGPILHTTMDEVRQRSGAWTPLYTAQSAQSMPDMPLSMEQFGGLVGLAREDAREKAVAYKAINIYGETCYFGVESTARAWAKSGAVEEVLLRDLRVVAAPTPAEPPADVVRDVRLQVESEFAALLPGVTYMDEPDGGSPTVQEQVKRMALDAERYRFVKDYDNPDNPIAICRFEESGWDGQWVIEHDPDAVIDAAMAREAGNG